MSESELTFTGERFLPDCEREIWYEHYHRYTMALDWVADCQVLDAACGEGYGTALLAEKAAHVTGVDVDEVAIRHAEKHYQRDNLSYQKMDVLNLEFADDSFDVVVSFETLEHLVEHDQLIQEFKRVLKPDGVLLISTPDKLEYTDKTGFNNEYHLKELYAGEFESLMQSHFKHHRWFGQKLMFSSGIWQLDQAPNSIRFDCLDQNNQVFDKPLFNPIYLLVASSDDPDKANMGRDYYHFTELAEQVYGHYHAVIRAHIKAEQDCQALEAQQKQWLQHPIIGRCIRWFGRK